MTALFKRILSPSGSAKRNVFYTFGMRMLSVVLAFGATWVLTKLLPLAEYGTYTLALTWLNFLTVPTSLGMDRYMVREVAVFRSQKRWDKLHGFMRFSNLAVFLSSALVAGVGMVVLYFTLPREGTAYLSFVIALLALPAMSLTTLRDSAMRGFNHIVQGQWPELALRPALIIIFSVLGYYLLPHYNAAWATLALAVATVSAFLVGALLLRGVLKRETEPAKPSYEWRSWLITSLPFMLISFMYVLNNRTSLLMLGALGSKEDVGLYNVAARGADFVAMILLVVNTVYAPIMARLYAEGKQRQLEATTGSSTRIITLVSLPVALGFIFFGDIFLNIMGNHGDFLAARGALTILCLGQLINAATGTVAMLLNMTKHERDTALVVGLSALGNVILNLLLIPPLGLEGAAIASTLGTIIWNVLLSYFVYKRLGFYSVLGIFTLRKKSTAAP